ncbi:hypothetical protein Tco_0022300, partial [Tanacetum coccineum]
IIMSDSEHFTVTYTSVSEDDSDIGSPGVDGPPIMPEDPYAYIMAAYGVPPSADYIPDPEDRPTIAREDLYGFVDMVDVPPRCLTSRELDYGITDTWDDLVGATDEIAPTTVEEVNQRVIDLATIVEEETTSMDRLVHRRLAVMIEREAKMAREAWGLSMDASDYARSDVMSLRTIVVAQSALISKLQSADHRR